MTIRVKRIYESRARDDGTRVLVDRIWPRGMSKEAAAVDHWVRDVAPSTELRKWFGHEPDKWPEFKRRFFAELDAAPEAVAQLRELVSGGDATLLFAAKEERYNNAVALQEYLSQ